MSSGGDSKAGRRAHEGHEPANKRLGRLTRLTAAQPCLADRLRNLSSSLGNSRVSPRVMMHTHTHSHSRMHSHKHTHTYAHICTRTVTLALAYTRGHGPTDTHPHSRSTCTYIHPHTHRYPNFSSAHGTLVWFLLPGSQDVDGLRSATFQIHIASRRRDSSEPGWF